MEKKEYHIQILDNGIALSIPEDEMLMCKEFSNDGRSNDENMHKFLGEALWQDLLFVSNNELVNNLKVTITIEPDNDGK